MSDSTWTCPACSRTHPNSVGQCHHRDGNAANLKAAAAKAKEVAKEPVKEPAKKVAKVKEPVKAAPKGASDESSD